KKVLIFLLVGVAHLTDMYLLGNGNALRTAVVFFYISNEGISMLENATVIGLPVPEKLKEALAQIKARGDGKDGAAK
ncbi:MAG TPA: holin, partial [Ruminococcaceae bacterium]|nr:holin [Oscillospiraceae bacterium]